MLTVLLAGMAVQRRQSLQHGLTSGRATVRMPAPMHACNPWLWLLPPDAVKPAGTHAQCVRRHHAWEWPTMAAAARSRLTRCITILTNKVGPRLAAPVALTALLSVRDRGSQPPLSPQHHTGLGLRPPACELKPQPSCAA